MNRKVTTKKRKRPQRSKSKKKRIKGEEQQTMGTEETGDVKKKETTSGRYDKG